MQKPFTREGFPAKVGPVPFLGLSLLSQTGMSFVQQGLVVLGVFFVMAYHLNFTELGFITTALSLGVMVSMVFVGVAVDRVGPRMVLFWGALLMAGFSALLLTVRGYAGLLVVLFLVGVSLAIAPSAGTKAVFTAFLGRPRGLVMGIRQTGVPLGAAISAALLPRLVPAWGLPPIFVLFAAELLISGWAFAAVMKSWRTTNPRTVRVHLNRGHWTQLLRPALVAFLLVSGQYILLTYSIADLHQDHRMSLAMAGIVLASSQIGGGVGRIVMGHFSDRMSGRRAPVVAFAATLGACSALVVALLPGTAPVWILFLIWTIFGFGAVGWNALALTWAGESVPSAHSGFAMSLTGTIVFLGSAIFPPIFGVIVDSTHHFADGWWMLSLILGIAAVIAWRSTETHS
ncbi:MAG: MFS transporter [Sulfobacillus sp.]